VDEVRLQQTGGICIARRTAAQSLYLAEHPLTEAKEWCGLQRFRLRRLVRVNSDPLLEAMHAQSVSRLRKARRPYNDCGSIHAPVMPDRGAATRSGLRARSASIQACIQWRASSASVERVPVIPDVRYAGTHGSEQSYT
jgi:hypothetical protein